eukprot:m.15856 g.15856  ORF g.15856 m.15856 type:complete len:81 (-) comp7909_c0_seq1:124-366(-)
MNRENAHEGGSATLCTSSQSLLTLEKRCLVQSAVLLVLDECNVTGTARAAEGDRDHQDVTAIATTGGEETDIDCVKEIIL